MRWENRSRKLLNARTVLAAAALAFGLGLAAAPFGTLRAEEPSTYDQDNEMSRPISYDEVIIELVKQFKNGRAAALDAANKLSSMGKRAVPVLADVLKKHKDDEVRYYAAMALARIPHKSAAQALLPLLREEKVDKSMRLVAIGAAGAEGLDEAIDLLKDLATKDPDSDLRFKTLLALSVMPNAWARTEDLFTKGLADPRDDIRTLSAKVCHQTAAVKIFYYSAEEQLLKLMNEEKVIPVRCNAMAALARMKSQLMVADLVKILADENEDAAVTKQALHALGLVTGVPIRSAKAVGKWWTDFGQKRYAGAKALYTPEMAEKRKTAEAQAEGRPPTASGERKKLQAMPNDEAPRPYSGVTMGGE